MFAVQYRERWRHYLIHHGLDPGPDSQDFGDLRCVTLGLLIRVADAPPACTPLSERPGGDAAVRVVLGIMVMYLDPPRPDARRSAAPLQLAAPPPSADP